MQAAAFLAFADELESKCWHLRQQERGWPGAKPVPTSDVCSQPQALGEAGMSPWIPADGGAGGADVPALLLGCGVSSCRVPLSAQDESQAGKGPPRDAAPPVP